MPARRNLAVVGLGLALFGSPISLVGQPGPFSQPQVSPPPSVEAGADSLTAAAAIHGPGRGWSTFFGLPSLGSSAEDRLRIADLRDGDGFPLLRSSSLLLPAPDVGRRVVVRPIVPQLTYVWNSDLPSAFGNDAGLWAGRGANAQVTLGLLVELGPARLVLAPQVNYQRNGEFQIFAFEAPVDTLRNVFSNPWHADPQSIDLPSRFGAKSFTTVDPGQSSLEIVAGPVAFGAATENLWWGPGIRNAIVMSSNAAGFPHAFVRTPRPLATRIGEIEAMWILGRLDESDYFDRISRNDTRSLSGIALVVHPAFERNLAAGFARTVYSSRRDRFPGSILDAFRNVGRPNSAPAEELEPGTVRRGRDQVLSLFARWSFPGPGLEAYAEWARSEQPASLRDFLLAPHHSQGYTIGLQWVGGLGRDNDLRLQAEATYLEPSGPSEERAVATWYTSRAVAQGYTHEGQTIGAAIGPGASSQWIAFDFLSGDRTQIGVFGSRVRWDTGAFYMNRLSRFIDHDVSVFVGARLVRSVGVFDLSAEISSGTRFNYLFQNASTDFSGDRAVDIRNTSFRFAISSRGPERPSPSAEARR